MTKHVRTTGIEQKIFTIRGERVMIDRDLAELFGVETRHLNRQVRRNIKRFPEEFAFRLTKQEKDQLVPNWHHLRPIRFSRFLPYVFTEQGVHGGQVVGDIRPHVEVLHYRRVSQRK